MRRLLLAALVAAPLAGSALPASAYCDPKYEPFCTNDCQSAPPNIKDPLEYLSRVCPD